jgi:hypothetical protein
VLIEMDSVLVKLQRCRHRRDTFNRLIVRKHRHYGGALAGVRDLRAERAVLRARRLGGAVEDRDLMSGFRQICRDGRPHMFPRPMNRLSWTTLQCCVSQRVLDAGRIAMETEKRASSNEAVPPGLESLFNFTQRERLLCFAPPGLGLYRREQSRL